MGLSCIGSTMAVRPDAPRQPGLLEVNAAAAGSVSLADSCLEPVDGLFGGAGELPLLPAVTAAMPSPLV